MKQAQQKGKHVFVRAEATRDATVFHTQCWSQEEPPRVPLSPLLPRGRVLLISNSLYSNCHAVKKTMPNFSFLWCLPGVFSDVQKTIGGWHRARSCEAYCDLHRKPHSCVVGITQHSLPGSQVHWPLDVKKHKENMSVMQPKTLSRYSYTVHLLCEAAFIYSRNWVHTWNDTIHANFMFIHCYAFAHALLQTE